MKLKNEFLENLRELQGIDASALIASLDTPPAVSLRRNRRKPADIRFEGIEMEPVEWCRSGLYLSSRPSFSADPLLHAGAYYVQDASSMIYQQIGEKLVGRLLPEGNTHDLQLLDFCAAPGGKTTALINALPEGTMVVANEFVPARGKILRENLEKWGYPWVITTGSSSSVYSGLPPVFDIVAVDAPCSGEGMMRKEEEARRQWTEALVSHCAALQREILTDLAPTVRPGGYLIYSTCTFNTAENESNSIFIEEKLGFEKVSVDSLFPEGIMTASRGLMPGVEALRFMPHLTRGEGLYVSVFRRPVNDNSDSGEDWERLWAHANDKGKWKKKGKGKQVAPTGLSAEMRVRLEGWFRPEIEPEFLLNGELVTMLPRVMLPLLDLLRRHGVNITGAGLPVAVLKGRPPGHELVPDSRVVLNSGLKDDCFPVEELDIEEAERYLRRESFALSASQPKGFVAVSYGGLPLGLMKNIGNRANNLFPSAWSLR